MRTDLLFFNLQKDVKTYGMFVFILFVYRILFIIYFYDGLAKESDLYQLWLSNYWGLKLSLKSALMLTTVPFFCTVANLVYAKVNLDRIRIWILCMEFFFLSVLFVARLPYYRVFLNTFDSNMLGVLYENFPGLWAMCLEYNVGEGLIAAFVLTFFWAGLARKWVFTNFFHLKGGGQRFGFLAVVIVFIFFARMGGSFTASSSAIDWANYSRLKDHLLNEAILDDMQAMLRVFRLYKDSGLLYGIHENNIAQSCFSMNGSVHSHLLSAYLQKEASGALIEKPKHIFIIFGESQAQWPLLKQYRALGIAEGLHSLIARKDAVSADRFLPVGTNTSLSVQGILTGLPCVYKNNHKIPTGGRSLSDGNGSFLEKIRLSDGILVWWIRFMGKFCPNSPATGI